MRALRALCALHAPPAHAAWRMHLVRFTILSSLIGRARPPAACSALPFNISSPERPSSAKRSLDECAPRSTAMHDCALPTAVVIGAVRPFSRFTFPHHVSLARRLRLCTTKDLCVAYAMCRDNCRAAGQMPIFSLAFVRMDCSHFLNLAPNLSQSSRFQD